MDYFHHLILNSQRISEINSVTRYTNALYLLNKNIRDPSLVDNPGDTPTKDSD